MGDFENRCSRCGKLRIFKRKWIDETSRGPAITHIETVCPDPECQKIVDEEFAAIREKRLSHEKKTEERKKATASISPKR